MADYSEPSAVEIETATQETPSQRQARIRKEKREAKIRDGGNARLNKIIGLGGGLPRDEAPPAPAPVPASGHADPEEVDISNHYYEPQSRAPLPRQGSGSAQRQQQQMSDDQLRQMMLGMDPGFDGGAGAGVGAGQNPFEGAPGQNPFAGLPGMGAPDQDGANDPMMQILQQMMGGMGGAPGEGQPGMPAFPGIPGMPGMGLQGQAQAAAVDPYAYIWRIVHAAFALTLGLYIALATSFTGSKYAREISGLASDGLSKDSVHFFWIFATAEVVLLTSRFYLEKGNSVPEGMMGTIMGFLPEPWKGYLSMVLRYGKIWGTVSGDAMVCVFVLGACAWLRGGM